MGINRKDIEIRIEELVLHGFPSEIKTSIAEAAKVELERLLEDQGEPSQLTRDISVENLYLESLVIGDNKEPENIGVQIAGILFEGLNK
jgi:hypothetical protein